MPEGEMLQDRVCGSETGSYLRLTDFVYHSTLGSETGSYSRLTDFVYHSTLGLRVIKKKKKHAGGWV